MKIAIASGIFHPDSGGPATYLHRLLPDLLAQGHAVRVLTYGNAPTTGYPYPVTRVPFGNLPARLARYTLNYRALASWADVIYVNTLGLPRFSAPRRPLVMKIVGDYAWERAMNAGWLPPDESIDAFQHKRYDDWRIAFFKWARAVEACKADQVIVPSDYLRRMVIGWGASPDHVMTVYNALDTHTASDTASDTAPASAPSENILSQSEARMQLGWSADGQYLFTAARMTAWKGIDYLLRAVHALQTELPRLRLVVAGDGPVLNTLKVQAAALSLTDRVRFLGKVPNTQISAYMRAADYFVLYSAYEGMAHTLLEALYAGVPCIASDRGGNPEIIRHNQNGLLVAHPDGAALIDAIRTAFTEGLRARLAAATSIGLERFSWPTLVQQTTAILERESVRSR